MKVVSSSGRWVYQVTGSSGTPYVCLPHSVFCQCMAFKYAVLKRREHPICKHVLASRLATEMKLVEEKTVSDEYLADILANMEWHSTDTLLTLYWYSTDTLLTLYWYFPLTKEEVWGIVHNVRYIRNSRVKYNLFLLRILLFPFVMREGVKEEQDKWCGMSGGIRGTRQRLDIKEKINKMKKS